MNSRGLVRPITSADLRDVSHFLHAELNRRLSPAKWEASIRPTWTTGAPNHGFMLVADGKVVGVQLAFYSEREIDGEIERFCNVAAWCVAPAHRSSGLRLLGALLAQSGYTFTDLSPSGNVVPLNRRLRFETLDTRTALVFNLPRPTAGGVRIVADGDEIEGLLGGRDLAIFRDHRTAHAAHHRVIQRGRDCCYVVFRRDRRKRLPLFASMLHVGNPDLFGETCQHFFSHLLGLGIVATMVEERVVACRPWHAVGLRAPRPRMFRSARLGGGKIDYLYSELVCVPW